MNGRRIAGWTARIVACAAYSAMLAIERQPRTFFSTPARDAELLATMGFALVPVIALHVFLDRRLRARGSTRLVEVYTRAVSLFACWQLACFVDPRHRNV